MGWTKVILYPLSLLYGLIAELRNLMFDLGVLRQAGFPVPVISVGNLSAGGSGKTPHVEYLVRAFGDDYRIAVISRGYKRKTRGFRLASPESDAHEIGDEPLQISRKFPNIVVAVHEKRRKGIALVLKQFPDTNLIILDDAFQHRHVKPGLNLLLTDYYNPFFDNNLLPSGTLREPKRRAARAHALIVTKTPSVFSPLDRKYFIERIRPYRQGVICFSTLRYGDPVPLNQGFESVSLDKIKTIFLLTGIARTDALEEHIKKHCNEVFLHAFPDHYDYTPADLETVKNAFDRSISRSKIILTTEKDAMRLKQDALKEIAGSMPIYYLPMEVVFHPEDHKVFHQLTEQYLLSCRIPDSGTDNNADQIPEETT